MSQIIIDSLFDARIQISYAFLSYCRDVGWIKFYVAVSTRKLDLIDGVSNKVLIIEHILSTLVNLKVEVASLSKQVTLSECSKPTGVLFSLWGLALLSTLS